MKKTSFAEAARFKVWALMVALLTIGMSSAGAQEASLEAQIRERSAAVEKQLIGWRRHIHQHPELGDQEQRTSRLVAAAPEASGSGCPDRNGAEQASSAF